ncbi:MAG TPA: hypothetical protein VMG32_01025 [Anaeromyxobacteraceae bacterium]|nr:hypothetical protein [Anaeromyxobacteraceae bacterium]
MRPRPALALLGGLLASRALAAPGSDAPMGLRTEGTFSTLFLEMTLADARALEKPELDLRWTLANDWSTPTLLTRGSQTVLLQTDEQADALSASLRVPWSRLLGPGPPLGPRPLWQRFSTALEVRITEHWGGWSDPVIEWWHGFINSINFERDLYPQNAIHVTLEDPATGRGLDIRSARLAFGDLVLRTQFLIAEGGASAVTPGRSRYGLSARLDLKLPAGSPQALGGSGHFDAGGALLGTFEIAPWLTAHAMLALSAFGGLSVPVGLAPETWHYTLELSLPVRLGAVTLLLEDRLTSRVFEDGWSLPSTTTDLDYQSSGYYGTFRAQNQMSGGVRYGAFTWWFSEDFTPGSNPHSPDGWFYDSNTPDIATGITYRTSL